MPTVEENLRQLRGKVEALLVAGVVPLIFLDLDETLNRCFGAPIEEQAVASLRYLDETGGLFGPNTGADLLWAGQRILSRTDRFFPFPFLLLAIGKHIAAWVASVQAYVLLPIQAANKGQAMRALVDYLELSLAQCLFIADFPGAGESQEGIDDPVLKEPVGVLVNVGWRRPEELQPSFPQTLLLHPQRRGTTVVGTGYEATVHYIEEIAAVLQHGRYAAHVHAGRVAVMRAIEHKLHLPALPNREHQLWTYEQPLQEADSQRPVLIRVQGAGLVHAGVNRGGKWIRVYDVPLQEVLPGVWEAAVLDPEVNALTFLWYGPNSSGLGHWEGKNYFFPRRTFSGRGVSLSSSWR